MPTVGVTSVQVLVCGSHSQVSVRPLAGHVPEPSPPKTTSLLVVSFHAMHARPRAGGAPRAPLAFFWVQVEPSNS